MTRTKYPVGYKPVGIRPIEARLLELENEVALLKKFATSPTTMVIPLKGEKIILRSKH